MRSDSSSSSSSSILLSSPLLFCFISDFLFHVAVARLLGQCLFSFHRNIHDSLLRATSWVCPSSTKECTKCSTCCGCLLTSNKQKRKLVSQFSVSYPFSSFPLLSTPHLPSGFCSSFCPHILCHCQCIIMSPVPNDTDIDREQILDMEIR